MEQRVNVGEMNAIAGKYGMIVCGPDANSEYQEQVLALSLRLHAPIIADPLSNMRSFDSENIIDSYDTFLRDSSIWKALAPQYVIHLGQVPVSKRLQQFLSHLDQTLYIQIDEVGEYRCTARADGIYITDQVKRVIKSLDISYTDLGYLRMWIELQQETRDKINQVSNEKEFFEGRILKQLQCRVPENSTIVAANSMAIRDIDFFWEAQLQKVKILYNRGANGIDGTISTALGISTNGKTTILVTGDLAFFHDLNGLLIGKTHGLDLIIILMNNDGGGIFQYLPQHGEPHYDYLFRTSHGLDFRYLEGLYGIYHCAVNSYEEFRDGLSHCLSISGIRIIEATIDMQVSKRMHEKYT